MASVESQARLRIQRRWSLVLSLLHEKILFLQNGLPSRGQSLDWIRDANTYIAEFDIHMKKIREVVADGVFLIKRHQVDSVREMLSIRDIIATHLKGACNDIFSDPLYIRVLSQRYGGDKLVRQLLQSPSDADYRAIGQAIHYLLREQKIAEDPDSNYNLPSKYRKLPRRKSNSGVSADVNSRLLQDERDRKDSLQSRVWEEEHRQAFRNSDPQPRSQFRRFRN